jgi:hypothetical protein
VIQDSIQKPLQNTNVIAMPTGKTEASTEFSVFERLKISVKNADFIDLMLKNKRERQF